MRQARFQSISGKCGSQWTRIVTGIIDTNGCLDQFVVPVDPRSPRQYFLLQEY